MSCKYIQYKDGSVNDTAFPKRILKIANLRWRQFKVEYYGIGSGIFKQFFDFLYFACTDAGSGIKCILHLNDSRYSFPTGCIQQTFQFIEAFACRFNIPL